MQNQEPLHPNDNQQLSQVQQEETKSSSFPLQNQQQIPLPTSAINQQLNPQQQVHEQQPQPQPQFQTQPQPQPQLQSQPQPQHLILPNRPHRSLKDNDIEQISLVTNHFQVSYLGDNTNQMYFFSFVIEPEISKDARHLREKVIKNCAPHIKSQIGGSEFVQRGWNLWAFSAGQYTPDSCFTVESNVQKDVYQVQIKLIGQISNLDIKLSLSQSHQSSQFLQEDVDNDIEENKTDTSVLQQSQNSSSTADPKDEQQAQQQQQQSKQNKQTALKDSLKSYGKFRGNVDPHLQIYNILIKQIMKKLNYQEIGRSSRFYNVNEKFEHSISYNVNPNNINDNNKSILNVWQGFKTSVNLCHKDSLLLLVDFSSRILRQQSALDFMNLFNNDQDARLELIGQSVIAQYGNFRTYRIDDVDLTMTPESFFSLQDGVKKTFIQYFQERYNVTIKVKNQPLLLHINAKDNDQKIYLVPELVFMTGLTDDMRADYKLMKNVSQFTKLEPQQRMRTICNFAEQLKTEAKKLNLEIKNCSNYNNNQKGSSQQQFNQSVQDQNNQYPVCSGFVLRPPHLQFQQQQKGGDQGFLPKNGNFQIRDTHVCEPADFSNWILIYFSKGKQDDQQADYFVDTLKSCGKAFGIKVKSPAYLTADSFKFFSWKNLLQQDLKQNGIPQIVVSMIPKNQKKSLYPLLKEYLIKECGVAHQNVVSQTLLKNQMSVCSKILLQMNAKIGKRLWITEKPSEINDSTMLIGIDAYYKKIAQKQTLVGFVSTTDSQLSQFFNQVYVKKNQSQIQECVKDFIQQACQQWKSKNQGLLPSQVIVYRDGLSQKQGTELINLEIQAFKQGFALFEPNYAPALAVILINKQINQRFFSFEQNGKSSVQQAKEQQQQTPQSQQLNQTVQNQSQQQQQVQQSQNQQKQQQSNPQQQQQQQQFQQNPYFQQQQQNPYQQYPLQQQQNPIQQQQQENPYQQQQFQLQQQQPQIQQQQSNPQQQQQQLQPKPRKQFPKMQLNAPVFQFTPQQEQSQPIQEEKQQQQPQQQLLPPPSSHQQVSSSLSNPQSGTIIADTVTQNNFDFYLCAQNVTQGTCTPTHFVVMFNETQLQEQVFWKLSYYQCFNYFNWSGAVRVPAPTQYAHKLSHLCGETFQKQPNQIISNQLYYL